MFFPTLQRYFCSSERISFSSVQSSSAVSKQRHLLIVFQIESIWICTCSQYIALTNRCTLNPVISLISWKQGEINPLFIPVVALDETFNLHSMDSFSIFVCWKYCSSAGCPRKKCVLEMAALHTTAGPGSPADESKNGQFYVFFLTGRVGHAENF